MNQNSTLLEFIKSKEAQKSQGLKASLEPRPMLGGWEVQGAPEGKFPMGVPDAASPAPSPFITNPALEGMDPNFARQMNVPSEIIAFPERGVVASTTGQVAPQPLVADFTRSSVSPIVGQSPSERGQPFAALSPSIQPASAGSMPIEAPISGSGMGNQPVLRDEAIAMGEQRLQGYRDSKELSPQAQMSIQRPSIKMGQEPNAGLPSKSIAPAQSIAPMGVEATQARLQERFGAPTISDIQAAPKGLGMQTDPQGRMIDPSVDLSSFEQASADREARQAAGTGFGQAQTRAAGTVTDRERRAARGEGMSDADRRDIAKANAPGASASDIARGGKVAELNRVDRKTGKPLAQEGAMTRAEDLAERKFQAELAENNRAWETAQADKAAETAAGVQETAQARQKTVERMDSQLSFLKNSAIEMAGLQDWSTEGFSGWVAEKLPFDTAAAQVNRLATSFQGNAFLRSIIDSKSLGATFGALSDNEGNKITAAETTLMDTKMGNEARMRAAKQIIDTIESAKSRAMKEQGWSSGSTNAPRYFDDQDDGVKVETYYQG